MEIICGWQIIYLIRILNFQISPNAILTTATNHAWDNSDSYGDYEAIGQNIWNTNTWESCMQGTNHHNIIITIWYIINKNIGLMWILNLWMCDLWCVYTVYYTVYTHQNVQIRLHFDVYICICRLLYWVKNTLWTVNFTEEFIPLESEFIHV